MLEKIRLTNYKAFEDTGEIRIAPVTLMLGKNNSGKSSILKALSLIQDGIAYGKDSQLKLKSDLGVIHGNTLQDLFHRRQFTDLGFYLDFTDTSYEIHFMSNSGKVQPHTYRLNSKTGGRHEAVMQNIDDSINGLYPTVISNKIPNLQDTMQFKELHIGPLRIDAPRLIQKSEASDSGFVGYAGENTYAILLASQLSDGILIEKVSEWFEQYLGVSIDFEAIDTEATNYRPMAHRGSIATAIADSGLGLAQVLPIITQSFIPMHKTVVCIEQPALHLHPAAHASVSSRLAESTLENDVRYIIESHSKNFLLGLRLNVATPDNKFDADNAAIYFVDGSHIPSTIRHIEIRPDGSLDYWPTGLFEEDTWLLDQILDTDDF